MAPFMLNRYVLVVVWWPSGFFCQPHRTYWDLVEVKARGFWDIGPGLDNLDLVSWARYTGCFPKLSLQPGHFLILLSCYDEGMNKNVERPSL